MVTFNISASVKNGYNVFKWIFRSVFMFFNPEEIPMILILDLVKGEASRIGGVLKKVSEGFIGTTIV